MRKCQITVFDYSDARHNASATHYDKDNPPDVVEYNVEAYCVGGDTGVRAYWIQDKRMYTAHGDDGFWSLTNVISIGWIQDMADAMIACLEEKS